MLGHAETGMWCLGADANFSLNLLLGKGLEKGQFFYSPSDSPKIDLCPPINPPSQLDGLKLDLLPDQNADPLLIPALAVVDTLGE